MTSILDDFDPPALSREWRNSRPSQRRAASAELKARHARERAQWLKDNPRVGRWTIIGLAPLKGTSARVSCVCDCGAKHDVFLSSLKSGKSTGCMKCRNKA